MYEGQYMDNTYQNQALVCLVIISIRCSSSIVILISNYSNWVSALYIITTHKSVLALLL